MPFQWYPYVVPLDKSSDPHASGDHRLHTVAVCRKDATPPKDVEALLMRLKTRQEDTPTERCRGLVLPVLGD